MPAAIAGSSIAIAAPALTEKDKCDNTIEYMANSPATQSAALFGLFGLFGKKKEETVNEPEHDWRYFDRNYESIKYDLFYGNKEEVNNKIDKFLNDLEQASVNKDSFNITKQAFEYIKTNIQEDRHKILTSDFGCNVHFLDDGLEQIFPRLIQDCTLPYENKNWINNYFEAFEDKELYPHARNNVLKNIINNID